MELIHPTDLAAWTAWRRSRRPLPQRARDLVRPSATPPTFSLVVPEDRSPVAVGVEARTPSVDAAMLDLVDHLDAPPHLVAPSDVDLPCAPGSTLLTELSGREVVERLPRGTVAVSTGHFLPAGALLHDAAAVHDDPFVVVQHGVLTPFAPPLPRTCTLLAWSEADARLWCGDRPGRRHEVVGSALLAAVEPADRRSAGPPVFLGQLHGIELGTIDQLRVATGFCRSTGATYRPHPSEVDVLSRAAHRLLRLRGVAIGATDVPLRDVDAPVVAIFSTGVLEAAARGGAAWVHHPRAAPWLRDLWQRYEMGEWGGEPTRPLPSPVPDPARAAAQLVGELVAA